MKAATAAAAASTDRANPNTGGGGGEKNKAAAAAMLKHRHASAVPSRPHALEAISSCPRSSAGMSDCTSASSTAAEPLSAGISYRNVLVQSIYRDHCESVAPELRAGTMEEVEEAAAAMSIYSDQWKAVADEDVVDDNKEDKASESDLWEELELELPLGAVEEKKVDEEKKVVMDDDDDEDEDDDEILLDGDEAAQHMMRSVRRGWLHCFRDAYGTFEDNTDVKPMRFTEGPIPRYACCESALQIFSVQVKEIKDGLEWPLHVYGHVAIRDSVDFRRNILFHRDRENCQILTQEDSYLLLTGPSRAVVLIDPVMFEIKLSARGEREHEDKILSLEVFHHDMINNFLYKTFTIMKDCHAKRSTLEFTFAELLESVEATIESVQVIDGSWPDHLRGKVVARTTSIGKQDIVLLDSRDVRMYVNCDGKIELSGRVVSVDLKGKVGSWCVCCTSWWKLRCCCRRQGCFLSSEGLQESWYM